MTTKTISSKPYMISKINTLLWSLSLVFFVGNCVFIALTTFSVIERQTVSQNIRTISNEISAHELTYLEKERAFSMDTISEYGFVTPETVAFSQKASWFAFHSR